MQIQDLEPTPDVDVKQGEYEPPGLDDLPAPEGPTVTSGGVVTNLAAPRDL